MISSTFYCDTLHNFFLEFLTTFDFLLLNTTMAMRVILWIGVLVSYLHRTCFFFSSLPLHTLFFAFCWLLRIHRMGSGVEKAEAGSSLLFRLKCIKVGGYDV